MRLVFSDPAWRQLSRLGKPVQKRILNVTLKLDADLLREARVLAAEEGRSISALLTERLETLIRERKAFDKARRRALTRLREGLDLQWTPPKSRDELHER